MEFSSHRNQPNYPAWLGVILFVFSLLVWLQMERQEPTTVQTQDAQQAKVVSGSVPKTEVAKVPSVTWEIIHSQIPEKRRLRQCLEKQGFDSSLVLVGSPSAGLTIMHPGLAHPIALVPEGPQVTLTTRTGTNIFSETRMHVGVTYCLYDERARVFDPVLKRTYEKAAWPSLGPGGSAPISFFITVNSIASLSESEGTTGTRWRTRGMSRLRRSDLVFDASHEAVDEDEARRFLLVVAARIAGAQAGTRSLVLKNFGTLILAPSDDDSDREHGGEEHLLTIHKPNGEPIEFNVNRQKAHKQTDGFQSPARPSAKSRSKRAPTHIKRKKRKTEQPTGFKPDYR